MKVAVTGGTGFVGSHLIDRLLADGHEISVLVRNAQDSARLRSEGADVVSGDVTAIESVTRLVQGSDAVINLARAKAHGASASALVKSVNIVGASNVAAAAARAGAKLVHASSTAVYGARVKEIPAREDSPLNPDTTYAKSKLDGENAVRSEHGGAKILRISAVLGPRCTSWLSLFRSARAGTLRMVGQGRNIHHPVDVADVVDAIVLSMTSSLPGAIHNVAGPESCEMRELARLMASSAGSTRTPRRVPPVVVSLYGAIGNVTAKVGIDLPKMKSILFLNGNRSFDISRARIDLGFDPRYDAATSIARTGEWYRSQGLL